MHVGERIIIFVGCECACNLWVEEGVKGKYYTGGVDETASNEEGDGRNGNGAPELTGLVVRRKDDKIIRWGGRW